MVRYMNACFRCLMVLIFLGFSSLKAPVVGASPLKPSPLRVIPPPPRSMSADILRYVNAHRRGIGLSALQANSFISSVALDHSRDMLTGRSAFGHDGFHDRINRIKGRLGT